MRRFQERRRGASIATYGIAVGLVALGASLAISQTGEQVRGLTTTVASSVNAVDGALSGNQGPSYRGPAVTGQSVDEFDAMAAIDARGFVDAEGDRLDYTLSLTGGLQSGDFTVQEFADGLVIDGTPSASGTLAVVATDPIGRKAVAGPLEITVAPNQAPVFHDARAAIGVVEANETFSIDLGRVSDPEGDALLSAVITDAGSGQAANFAVTGTDPVRLTGTPDHQAAVELTVTWTDVHGASTAAGPFEVPVVADNTTCRTILETGGAIGSGTYTIDPDDNGGAVSAQCDMETAGGGWTLVLNYLHRATTRPLQRVLTDRLPLPRSDQLGLDESGSPENWGHASNALFSRLNPAEIRFYCRTSAHSRTVHFRTDAPSILSYFATGSGVVDPDELRARQSKLAGHTAVIPDSGSGAHHDNGDLAMTDFPFFRGASNHWGVGAYNGVSDRWECDDFPNGPDHDTLHRVWVR